MTGWTKGNVKSAAQMQSNLRPEEQVEQKKSFLEECSSDGQCKADHHVCKLNPLLHGYKRKICFDPCSFPHKFPCAAETPVCITIKHNQECRELTRVKEVFPGSEKTPEHPYGQECTTADQCEADNHACEKHPLSSDVKKKFCFDPCRYPASFPCDPRTELCLTRYNQKRCYESVDVVPLNFESNPHKKPRYTKGTVDEHPELTSKFSKLQIAAN